MSDTPPTPRRAARLLRRDDSPVQYAAFSATRTLLATTSQVMLLDAAFELVAAWEVPDGRGNDGVSGVAVTPDGRWAAIATGRCGVFRWDLSTLEVETLCPQGPLGFHHGVGGVLLGNHPFFMDGVAISDDGACVAALRRDVTEREAARKVQRDVDIPEYVEVVLYTGGEARQRRLGEGRGWSVAFRGDALVVDGRAFTLALDETAAPDAPVAEHAASGARVVEDGDRGPLVLHTTTGATVVSATWSPERLCRFSDDGGELAVVDADYRTVTFRAYDAATGALRIERKVTAETTAIVDPARWRVVTSGYDRAPIVVDLRTGLLVASIGRRLAAPVAVEYAMTPGSLRATACDATGIYVHDVAARAVRFMEGSGGRDLEPPVFSEDASTLYALSGVGELFQWRVADGRRTLRATVLTEEDLDGDLPSLLVSEDGSHVCVATNSLPVFDASGVEVGRYHLDDFEGDDPKDSVFVSVDGARLYRWSASRGGEVAVTDARRGDEATPARVLFHAPGVMMAAHDRHRLFVVADEGAVRAYDLRDGALRASFEGFVGKPTTLAISASGVAVAARNHDGDVCAWTLAAPTSPHRFDAMISLIGVIDDATSVVGRWADGVEFVVGERANLFAALEGGGFDVVDTPSAWFDPMGVRHLVEGVRVVEAPVDPSSRVEGFDLARELSLAAQDDCALPLGAATAALREALSRGAPVSLRGANLALADLRGVDLRGADLSGCVLDGTDLRGADLTGARLDGAQLRWTRLVGARLDGATLDGCTVDTCDVSLTGRTDDAWSIELPGAARMVAAALSRDGERVAVVVRDGDGDGARAALFLLDARRGTRRWWVELPAAGDVVFAPDASTVWVIGPSYVGVDAETGAVRARRDGADAPWGAIHECNVPAWPCAMSPDGRHLARVGEDRATLTLVDLGSMEAVCALPLAEPPAAHQGFPRHAWRDRTIVVYERGLHVIEWTGDLPTDPSGYTVRRVESPELVALRFTSDGALVAVDAARRFLRFDATLTGHEVVGSFTGIANLWHCALVDDGAQFFASEGALLRWFVDGAPGPEVIAPREDEYLRQATISEDGSRVAALRGEALTVIPVDRNRDARWVFHLRSDGRCVAEDPARRWRASDDTVGALRLRAAGELARPIADDAAWMARRLADDATA